MCEHANLSNAKCNITLTNCPYIYFCNRSKTYQLSKNMPDNCKVKKNFNIPKGSYKVCFERHNNLYIEVDNYIEVMANPFGYTPEYVKLGKNKQGKFYIKK